MASQRIARVNQLLRREVSSVMYRILQGNEEVDMAAITIADVDTAPDLRHAHVYISVLGDAEDASRVVSRLNGRRKEIQNAVVKNVTLKYTPQLHFHLSKNIVSGDTVLGILNKLEEDNPEWAEEDYSPDDFESEEPHGS